MPKYKVRIDNNQSFTLKDGFTYEDNLNETLDSAKVVFETTSEVNVESFDDITIYDDSIEPSIQEKNMLVDSGMDEIAYFEPVEAKKYELNIFSRTKWLERFTCPNLTTTKTKKIISTTTSRFSGQLNVMSSLSLGQSSTLIPLGDNMSNVVYHSTSIHASIQNNGELLNLTKYYYNDSSDNNLPSSPEHYPNKYVAAKKAPSGTSSTYKLIDKDVHTYNSYLETGDLPIAPFNNGQVVCNVLTPNNIPYNDPLYYIDLYTDDYLLISEQSSWASQVGGVSNDSHLRVVALEDAGTGYIPANPGDSTPRNLTFRFSVGNGYFEVLRQGNVIATITTNNDTYTMSGSDMMNYAMTFRYKSNGQYSSGSIYREAFVYDVLYPEVSISMIAYSSTSPTTLTYQSADWKKLFYPASNKYFEYYYYNGWVRWGEITDGVKGKLRNTKDWYQWNDTTKNWDSLTLTYDSATKFARYNSGTGQWSFANTNTSTPYIYVGDSKVYKWDGTTWNEVTNYTWNLFKSTTNGWSDQGAINSNNLYTYSTDYYKWDGTNKEWVNGIITQSIINTYPNGQIIFELGDSRNADNVIPGVIAYDVTVNVNTYGDPSVWLFIQRYCELYLPKVHVRNASNVLEYLSRYKIASRVQTKFEGITCPEFQWNEPTLREVLTDLMSTANCIPIINSDNEIDYIEISLTYNPIDTSKIERIRSSFVSSDCCNELTVSLKNAIGKVSTRITEYTSLRSLTGEITTENAVLKTQKPIYDIKKIILCQFRDAGVQDQDPYKYHEIDITKYVVEKREWDTLKTVGTISPSNYEEIKATHAYYTRGSNTIDGWGLMYTMRGFMNIKTTQSTLYWMLNFALSAPLVSRGDMRDFMFKVEYETLSEHSMHVGKYLPSKHYGNRIFDNQSNSYVDVQHQSIFEYCKVNRLGNKIKTMYAIYDSEIELPKLGDYITQNGERLVLFNRKIQYYDSQLVFEGQMVANYVLKDYFTGIMAKKRSWAIAEGKEALDRRDVYKYYVEASFSNKTDNEASSLITYAKLLSAFTDYAAGNSIKWTLMRTIDESTHYFPSTTELYSLESTMEVAGNSLIVSFGLGDNFSAGSYSEVDEDGAYHNNDYPYANDFGEFEKANLYFASYVNPSDGDFTWPSGAGYSSESTMNTVYAKGRIKNKVKESAATKVFSMTNKYIYKDNREIISGEIQFELCSDTPNIIVKNPIWEYSSLYNDDTYNKSSLSVYASNDETYELNDEYAKGTVQGNGSLITLNNNQVSVSFSGLFKSWAICDSNGKILIAVNSTSVKAVYLNLLSTRDRHIYNLNREIVGSLDS